MMDFGYAIFSCVNLNRSYFVVIKIYLIALRNRKKISISNIIIFCHKWFILKPIVNVLDSLFITIFYEIFILIYNPISFIGNF